MGAVGGRSEVLRFSIFKLLSVTSGGSDRVFSSHVLLTLVVASLMTREKWILVPIEALPPPWMTSDIQGCKVLHLIDACGSGEKKWRHPIFIITLQRT